MNVSGGANLNRRGFLAGVAGLALGTTLVGGSGTRPEVDSRAGRFTPLDFGALADGVSDDTDAFRKAYEATKDSGFIAVPPGRYMISGTIAGSHPLKLRGSGADVCRIVRPAGTIGPVFSISGAKGEKSLLANEIGQGEVNIKTNTTEFDAYLLGSNQLWQGTNKSARVGEIVHVSALHASDNAVLESPTRFGYLPRDGGFIQGLRMSTGSVVTGITIENLAPMTKANDAGLEFTLSRDLTLESLTFIGLDGAAIRLHSVVNAICKNIHFRDLSDSEDLGFFGYGVDMRDASSGLQVANCTMDGGRHLFTTNSWGESGDYYGIPREAVVLNCLATRVTNAAFDTHPEGSDITFIDCKSVDGLGVGFSLRAPGSSIFGCLVDGAIGHAVWVRSTAAGSYVDGRFFKTRSGSVGKYLGSGSAINIDSGCTSVTIGTAVVADCDSDGVYIGRNVGSVGVAYLSVSAPGKVSNKNAVRIAENVGTVSFDTLSTFGVDNALFGDSTVEARVSRLEASDTARAFDGGMVLADPFASR